MSGAFRTLVSRPLSARKAPLASLAMGQLTYERKCNRHGSMRRSYGGLEPAPEPMFAEFGPKLIQSGPDSPSSAQCWTCTQSLSCVGQLGSSLAKFGPNRGGPNLVVFGKARPTSGQVWSTQDLGQKLCQSGPSWPKRALRGGRAFAQNSTGIGLTRPRLSRRSMPPAPAEPDFAVPSRLGPARPAREHSAPLCELVPVRPTPAQCGTTPSRTWAQLSDASPKGHGGPTDRVARTEWLVFTKTERSVFTKSVHAPRSPEVLTHLIEAAAQHAEVSRREPHGGSRRVEPVWLAGRADLERVGDPHPLPEV